MPLRLRAAAGLVIRQEEEGRPASPTCSALKAQAADMVRVIAEIERLPAANAVPALARLLEHGNDQEGVAAARALGRFPGAAIPVLEAAVARHQAVSPVWLSANASLARLGTPEGLRLAGSTHTYLAPEDLLAAGAGFHSAGDQRAEPFLLLVTRKADGVTQSVPPRCSPTSVPRRSRRRSRRHCPVRTPGYGRTR